MTSVDISRLVVDSDQEINNAKRKEDTQGTRMPSHLSLIGIVMTELMDIGFTLVQVMGKRTLLTRLTIGELRSFLRTIKARKGEKIMGVVDLKECKICKKFRIVDCCDYCDECYPYDQSCDLYKKDLIRRIKRGDA